MEDLGRALIADCAAICNDPQYQRSVHVRNLRTAVRQTLNDAKRLKKSDTELATAIQACARLEQNFNCGTDLETYKCNQDQVAGLLLAADSISAAANARTFMAERNKAALDASFTLFGTKGVIPTPEQLGIAPVGPRKTDSKPLTKTWTDGWQPRWLGDLGDTFEPYQQLIEQYLHSAVTYHTKALENLSSAFASVDKARKNSRDVAYLRTLAAAAGISVKEYQRLLEMFRKIDYENTGSITKRDMMASMKRDKDIAAFMQLARAKGKDGRRESFESMFNRIDSQGSGSINWENFLIFFSTDNKYSMGMEPTLLPPPSFPAKTMLPPPPP